MQSTPATQVILERHSDETTTQPLRKVRYQPGASDEHKLELCECMIDIASALFNVSSKELRKPGRNGLGVSRVRQIAMYVAHVVLGLTMNEVGRGFGRDRTTVLHACHLVEDMRDDEDFDAIVVLAERVAIAAFCREAQ